MTFAVRGVIEFADGVTSAPHDAASHMRLAMGEIAMGTVVAFHPRLHSVRHGRAERAYVTDARVLGAARFALLNLRRSAGALAADAVGVRGPAANLLVLASAVAQRLLSSGAPAAAPSARRRPVDRATECHEPVRGGLRP